MSGLYDVYDRVLAARQDYLRVHIATGTFHPYVLPYRTLGYYVPLIYLLLPPNKSRLYFYARYPVLAFTIYWAITVILECRSYDPAVSYFIGILNGFAAMWFCTVIAGLDARAESQRIVWKSASSSTASPNEPDGGFSAKQNGSASGTQAVATPATGHSHAANVDGTTLRKSSGSSSAPMDASRRSRFPANTERLALQYRLEPLPLSFLQRLVWVIDLLFCLRGTGWTHSIDTIPAPPTHVLESIPDAQRQALPRSWRITDTKGTAGRPSPLLTFYDKRSLLIYYGIWFIIYFNVLDFIKFLLIQDPYFIGQLTDIVSPLASSSTHTLPPLTPLALLPIWLLQSRVFSKAYRLTLGVLGMYFGFSTSGAMAPLFFVGLLSWRDEPWLYPSVFGKSYWIVAQQGLAGWWGLWWHQYFRLAFTAPHEAICRFLGIKDTKSMPGKIVGLWTAFILSATLHAAGSTTMMTAGRSRPLTGSALFFLLQPLAIMLEMWIKQQWRRSDLRGWCQKQRIGWVAKVATLIWVHLWLYFTGPIIADDVVAMGMLLTVPVPYSSSRLIAGKTPAYLEPVQPFWHVGKHWWDSGLAV